VTDVDISCLIERDLLALDPLEIADGNPYYLSTQFLGSGVAWDRQTVSSRWVDGEFTTSRRRGNVTEQVAVEIVAASTLALQLATQALIDAFTQDSFTMTITIDNREWAYLCEAADYQSLQWTTPRLSAHQGQVLFGVPRRPVAMAGGY
jgi:hypothetical protein